MVESCNLVLLIFGKHLTVIHPDLKVKLKELIINGGMFNLSKIHDTCEGYSLMIDKCIK